MVQFQDGPPRRLVGAAPVIQIGKGAEIRVVVGSLQHFRQRLLLDAGQVRFLRRLKVRRNVQRSKMLLHKMQAESIHRADGRPLQEQLLAAQAPIRRMGPHFGRQTGGDVRPQLGRRRIGEGHDKQAVGFHRVLGVRDEAHHPLHQHAGLAGPGRRRDQQAAAPGADGRRLGRCESNFRRIRHSVSPFYSSNGSPGMSTVRSFSPSRCAQAMRKSQ